MLKQLSERIIIGVLALVLLIWGGYHAFQYYNSPIKTETVFEYSVVRTIAGHGVAIRSEQVMEDSGSGIKSYLFDNATRVSVGETVAEFYATDAGDRNVRRMRELQTEIDMLHQAQDTNINNYANVDYINRELRDRIGALTRISSTGRCDSLAGIRQDLTSLVNRRQIATGKVNDFQPRISQLQAEYQNLNNQTSVASIHTVRAPVAGYFSRNTDGMESVITPKMLDKMKISDYIALMEQEPATYAIPTVGRMVTNQIWYLAVKVELHQTEWVSIGQKVNMEFEGSANAAPAVVIDVKMENNVDDAIILLRCDYMTEDLIDLRVTDVKLHSDRYIGLRVSTEALRFQNGVRGVYIIEDNTVQFRKLRPIYEESGYILSDMSASAVEEDDYKSVRLYDQVVTKGIVYDGMPIS